LARIALVQDVMVEYIGYMYISAVLKEAGHTVEIFVSSLHKVDQLLKELKVFSPEVVGFSVLSPSKTFALTVGQRVKSETKAITVFGNVHVILNREIIEEPGVDIICIGEGERPMCELCDLLDRKEAFHRIRGFWVKTADGIVRNDLPNQMLDINELPYHDRAIYDKYAYFRHSNYLRVGMGRGCPNRCSFCSNPVLADYYGGAKRYLRKQTPLRAIEELEATIRQRNKVGMILVTDEVLWVKLEWLREFLTLYKERIGVPLAGNFHLGPIKEEDIRLMAEAKVINLIVATESGDEHQRVKMLNKHVKNDRIFQVTEWLHKYKISFCSSVMFGLPGDSVEDHVSRLTFYRKIRPTYVYGAFFQPYSGLALTNSSLVQSYMPKEKEFQATLHHDIYLDLPDRARLVNLKKIYFLCIVFPWAAKFLIWLTKFEIPLLFNLLFLSHFTYYAVKFENISFIQCLVHFKGFFVDTILTKIYSKFGAKQKA
jgi:anaerobic magnesium-protoporphyrin IX monomethyl ester cyclase